MSETQAASFFEELWNNWCSGKGHCLDCPNRDSQCQFYPKFGEGVLNAEIAFVAEAPNEDRPSQNSHKSRKNRYGNFSSKVRENPVPGWIRDGNRFSDSFFEDISADFSGEAENGIYYTNIKKCADIKSGRADWKNSKAKLHCEGYLKHELEAVDPDVVVTFGKEATESLFEVFDTDFSLNKMKHEVLEEHKINSFKIIPSFHWSYLHLSISNLDNIGTKQDYWEELSGVIDAVEG